MITFANIALALLIFIVLLGVIVFIHELGHFLAAKRSGVVVQEFAFGFGPRIWGRKLKGTEYKINWIPLGGYCKMLGDQDGSSFLRYNAKPFSEEDKKFALEFFRKQGLDPYKDDYCNIEDAVLKAHKELGEDEYKRLQNFMVSDYIPNHPGNFDNVSRGKRIFIVSAGVIMNFILGVLIYYIYFFGGGYYVDVPKIGDPKFVGASVSNPPFLESFGQTDNAYTNSIIIDAEGKMVSSPDEFVQLLREKYNQPIALTLQQIKPDGYEYKKANIILNGDGIPSIFDQDIYKSPIISGVTDNSLAASIGLQPGDVLLSVNGQSLRGEKTLSETLPTLQNQELNLSYLGADGASKEVTFILPEFQPGKPVLGITYAVNNPFPDYILRLDYHNIPALSGIAHAINMTVYNVSGLVELVRQSIDQKSVEPVASGVTSVVGVSKVVYTLVEVKDFNNILNLGALVSLSLAVMNILPIPLFDGGHILFIIIEKIRGRKLSTETQERISMVAFYLLIALSVLIIFKDILNFGFVQQILNSIGSIFRG
jgi:regulator of sigma E protease